MLACASMTIASRRWVAQKQTGAGTVSLPAGGPLVLKTQAPVSIRSTNCFTVGMKRLEYQGSLAKR